METKKTNEDSTINKVDLLTRQLMSGKEGARGELICQLILEGGETGARAALNFITQEKNKKELVLEILRAQSRLWGWFREQVQSAIINVSGRIKTEIIQLLYEARGWDRHLVLLMVREIAAPEFITPLLDVLKTDEYWTKLLALDAIGQIGGKRVIEALIQALEDPDLCWSALAGLADQKATEAIRPVLKHLANKSSANRIEALRALRAFGDRRVLSILSKVAVGDKDPNVREKAILTMQSIAEHNKIDISADLKRITTSVIRAVNPLDPFLAKARTMGASDVHAIPDAPIACRLHGDFVNMSETPLTSQETNKILPAMLPKKCMKEFEAIQQVDFAYEIPGMGRFRGNIFQERRGVGGVFRVIPQNIPDIALLGLPQVVLDVKHLNQGMVIVTGRAGSGKTTTMAAITEMINRIRPCHIITLEDPVEYVFERKRALINQREVGRDTDSFVQALRAALREDPDVIVVGEMRDVETMRLAIQAAETGHLVLTTLHTPTAAQAVTRLIQSFPANEEPQVRLMVADSLKLVAAQTLIKKKNGKGRIGAFETLVVTHAISTLIKEKKEEQIPATMQSGRAYGMQMMDDALYSLVADGIIDMQEAIYRAQKKERFSRGG